MKLPLNNQSHLEDDVYENFYTELLLAAGRVDKKIQDTANPEVLAAYGLNEDTAFIYSSTEVGALLLRLAISFLLGNTEETPGDYVVYNQMLGLIDGTLRGRDAVCEAMDEATAAVRDIYYRSDN